jgi:hypothetical protein
MLQLFNPRHIARFVGIASVLLASAGALFYFSHNWNNPPKTETVFFDGVLEGRDPNIPAIHAKIIYSGPKYLTVPGTQYSKFIITLYYEPVTNGNQSNYALLNDKKHEIYVWTEASNAEFLLPQKNLTYILGNPEELSVGNAPQATPFTQTMPVTITTKASGPAIVRFNFVANILGVDQSGKALGTATWEPESRPEFWTSVLPLLYGGSIILTCAFGIFWIVDRLQNIQENTSTQLAQAQEKAENNPDKVKYAWEVARIKIQQYFDRNLVQVNLVFWAAILVVIVGFGFMIAAIFLCFNSPDRIGPQLVVGVCGAVTQFIGATFMVIYRSTMSQANGFMSVLERINTVDMAVQVLDQIPDDNPELKNQVRAQLVGLLAHRGPSPVEGPGAIGESSEPPSRTPLNAAGK